MHTPQTHSLRRNALGLLLALSASTPALAQITFYEQANFQGRSMTSNGSVSNFRSNNFNDRASSVVVRSQRWEVCVDQRYSGRCRVLRPGQYPSLEAMGLDEQISSVRAVQRNARDDELSYAPYPSVPADYRRRDRERLYQATVSDVRAIYGESGQRRCWTEREQVSDDRRSDVNVPGTVIGAVIGGILGHQVGGGTGRVLATAGGAVAGGVVGNNIGRNNSGESVVTRDVQRCDDRPAAQNPAYWDVTYNFRGQQHHMQVATPPGATVTVNANGEPRA
ncbi:beta/gamma crystallin-related protein [Roseateles sp. P5_E4]